jgi:DNA-binding transcriptional LysR family regulator
MNSRRPPRVSLDLLRGFRVAARHLSFTRAAQELFVTQPAISREIKTLEEHLGQPLFHRINRALQLTPAGEELYRVAEETLSQLDAVVDRIAGTGSSPAGPRAGRARTSAQPLNDFRGEPSLIESRAMPGHSLHAAIRVWNASRPGPVS